MYSVKPCTVSQEDSIIKEDVDIVGPFVPTVDTTITVENSQLIFEGPLSQEAIDLKVGNIVTTGTNDLNWYNFIIQGITTEDIGEDRQKITFDVISAEMADIFETFDAFVNADVNKRDLINYNCKSDDEYCEGRVRRKLQRRVARRLGPLGDFFDGVAKGFTFLPKLAGTAFKKIGEATKIAPLEFIGDAVHTGTDAIEGLAKLITGQELNKTYSLVKIDEKWNENIEDLVIFDADATFDVDLIAQFKGIFI